MMVDQTPDGDRDQQGEEKDDFDELFEATRSMVTRPVDRPSTGDQVVDAIRRG